MKRMDWVTVGVWLALVGCQPSPESQSSFQVVATSTILANLTAEVAGDRLAVNGLLTPGDDPHVYEPVPRDTVTLEQADLIIYNGYNLEPGLIRLIEGTSVTATKVALAETVPPLDFTYEGQTLPDPHVWGDAENVVTMVTALRDQLTRLDPAGAAAYAANAEALIAELMQLDRWMTAQVATIPARQRQLVTTHDAFQYYAQAYGLSVLGTLIGISTEEQPSAQTVQRLVQTIRAAGVPAIFVETTLNPQLIQTVAQEASVTLATPALYADALGAQGSGAERYVSMMVTNTETVVNALGGQLTPF